MAKPKKIIAVGASIAAAACMALGTTGCTSFFGLGPIMTVDELADTLTVSLLGNSAYNWNVFSVDPKGSFGVDPVDNATWYSYQAMTNNDIKQVRSLFNMFNTDLQRNNLSDLSAKDAVTYRTLEYTINSYYDYYNSDNALAYELIGGRYIDSFGGYVAEFASMFENYALRTENDVKNLLSMTKSTRSAFSSYLEYAAAREKKGYPLYDYTVCAMQDYLDDVTEQGDEYYLYSVAQSKLDGAAFLSASDKSRYKAEFASAIDSYFMRGVRELSSGLDRYKGNVVTTDKSYLAAYGRVGKKYYEWQFEEKTGIRNANIGNVYNEMLGMYFEKAERMEEITEYVDSAEQSDPALYNAFYAYKNGEEVMLGLTAPEAVLDYLKIAAQNIVPDLNSTPEIDFKYMDRTAGEISNVLAYYLLSPVDERNSAEHITLNPYTLESDTSRLLTTVAHEGYPGHLYAHVNAKERGVNALTLIQTCSSFSEGWAKYVEVATLRGIAAATDDRALQLYCEYAECNEITGYLNSVMLDIQVNYMGRTVADYVEAGMEEEDARYIVESLMEHPSTYVPYGYGFYVMLDIHDSAMASLGDKYDEVAFNGYLLSEGAGPTIPRAKALAKQFISKNK